MKFRSTILNVIAWTIIGIWLSRSTLFRLLNIDFTSIEIARNFRQIWLILMPLAVGIFIVRSWNRNTSIFKNSFGLSLGVLITIGFIYILNFLLGFCEWSFSNPIYKHRTKNVEIRERILGCGAYDSEPTHILVKTKSIGKYLTKYSEIKEEDIDYENWNKE